MKFVMRSFLEMEEPEPAPASPVHDKVEYPTDYDQYEHPYDYDHELPDDADTQEELDQVRETWSMKHGH